MALILTVRGVADFFREREIRVLQRAHHRRVHADIQRLAAIGIARRIQHAVERFRVGAFRCGQPDDRAIRIGHHGERARRIIDELRSERAELRVEFARKRFASAVTRRARAIRRLVQQAALSKRSKNCGSISRTRATISPITTRASLGVSLAADMRHNRCSTMPETVCTIVVKCADAAERSAPLRSRAFPIGVDFLHALGMRHLH